MDNTMKNIKQLLFIPLSLIFVLMSTLLTCLRVLPLGTGVAQSSDQIISDSLFFVDPSLVRVYKDNIYVYDESDTTIKIFDRHTKDFKETFNNYIAKTDDILFLDDVMLIFSRGDGEPSFTAVNLTNLKPVDFDFSSLTTLSNMKSMQIVSCENENYLLLYPTELSGGNFEIAKISVSENAVLLENPSTFEIVDNKVSSFNSYSISYAIEKEDGNILIMLASQNSIMSVNVNPLSPNPRISQTTTVDGLNNLLEGEEIKNINSLKVMSGEPSSEKEYLTLTTNKNIRFYNLDTSSPESVILEVDETVKVALDETFTFDDISSGGCTVAFVSSEKQTLKYYSFDENPASMNVIKNAEIEIEYFSEDYYNYKFVNQATNLLPSPYSKTEDVVLTIDEGDELVVIGRGYYKDSLTSESAEKEYVYGWDYVMFAKGTTNYYGYVYQLDLLDLEEDSNYPDIASVLPNTYVYSRPTKNVDNFNEILLKIESPNSYSYEVVDTIFGYGYINGNQETTFYRVKVTSLSSGESVLGYVDRRLVSTTTPYTDRIIPNATVKRNNSQIFKEKNDKSEVLTTLDKNFRVEVIGKRDTITNLTHVRFNDTNGRVVEGYIYTYNLEADSWNMVQMIGIVLIIINVILLIVIICLKNKVTR